jgi:hypothetical protein
VVRDDDPARAAGIGWLFPHERKWVNKNIPRWQEKLASQSPDHAENDKKLLNLAYAWLGGTWGLPAIALAIPTIILVITFGWVPTLPALLVAGFCWFMLVLRLFQGFHAYPHNVRWP